MNYKLHCSDIDSIEWKRLADIEPLQSNMHCWLINTSKDKAIHTKLNSVLSREEIARMNRYRKEDDRLRFLFAHGYKRILCGQYLNIHPRELVFDVEENNKPFISGKEIPIHFNFSHSHNKVLFVFHEKEFVGCDTEWIRTQFNFSDFMFHQYSQNEIDVITKLKEEPDQRKMFFKYWSRKESWLKTTGLGVFSDLRSVETAFTKNTIHSDAPLLSKFKTDFYMQSFQADDCYCSIAINGIKTSTLFFRI